MQVDEVWNFCYAKQKNVPVKLQGQFGYGSVWTWAALDADSKLIFSWLVGDRTADYAIEFMHDVQSRLANRVQLTTDGFQAYVRATEQAFNWNVDFAMLEKHYGMDPNKGESRYSPAKLQSIKVRPICGTPDEAHISTSFAERQNLTMRMGMRRFTRLTNAFSKKIENLQAAVSLHFMHYNFARVHQTLRIAPGMAAGVSDHVWEIREIVELLKFDHRKAACAVA